MAEKTKKTKSASGRGGAVKKSAATQRTAKTPSVSKKAAGNKKTAKAAGRTKTLSNEIKGIMLIALGIFLGFAFLTETTGTVGKFIKDVCYGLFGMSISISCIFIIVTGFMAFFDKEGEKNAFRYVLLSLLILVTSVIVPMATGHTSFTEQTVIGNITALWQGGRNSSGGGVIGGGLCGALNLLIGPAGTWVVSIAAEIIFIILLTGVSIEKILRGIGGAIKRRGEDYRDVADSEFELPEYSAQSDTVKQKLLKRRKNDEIDIPLDDEDGKKNKKEKKGFFGGYFEGEDVVDGGTSDEEAKTPRRFELTEDSDVLSDIADAIDAADDTSDLPFDIDSLKTGVLSELPDENGNYEKPVENEEGTDFEPPSEAKLEDVLDPLTKAAVDAGVPLDRAVTAGRRMAAEDAEEKTPEAEIKKQIDETEHNKPRNIQYRLPRPELLELPKPRTKSRSEVKAELEEKANRLLETLNSFKVEAKIVNITQGPTVTRFELQPGAGVKVSKITNLSDDIALSLAASGVRIEPVAGKSVIGIEIPNKVATPVPIREVITSERFRNFKSKTAFALGKDISGNCVVADIADFPHGLIAGATGSGKSVCINSLIISILFKARPDEVKMIMVDPKMVELGVYNGIPHLLIPVVTDPKHAAGALNWAVGEMKNRYKLLNENKVRNLSGYNALMDEIGEPDAKLPEIVIIIDELADLMMAAKSEVEGAINSLAALARAAGMYLIIATQRPSVNVVTGVIKNNIPTRIAFAVTSNVDSRTILDCIGAEKLLGKGDMLYSPRGAAKPLRVQGNFVSDAEREAVIDYIKSQYEASYDESIIENIEREREQVAANTEMQTDGDDERGGGQKDKMFYEAVEFVLENGQASVAMFQRKFKMGYQRAAKLIDQMEKYKIIGPYEGTKPRQVLITRQELNEMRMNDPNQ